MGTLYYYRFCVVHELEWEASVLGDYFLGTLHKWRGEVVRYREEVH